MFALSLLAQAPALALAWPLRPSAAEVALGLAAIAAGVALNLWAEATFRRWRVGVVPFSDTPCLMEDGPFRVTRNPMYLGMVLVSAGLALATGALVNLVFPAALAAWLDRACVGPEERFLAERFADEFAAYRRRAPRWIGWPGR